MSTKIRWLRVDLLFLSIIVLSASDLVSAQTEQAIDENGAPLFRVDPFWPGQLPNRWSMQQVTGIYVDHMDHIWFLNRGNGANSNAMAIPRGTDSAMGVIGSLRPVTRRRSRMQRSSSNLKAARPRVRSSSGSPTRIASQNSRACTVNNYGGNLAGPSRLRTCS